MKRDDQTYGNLKFQKFFDTCRLEGRWKRVDEFIPHHNITLEESASIELSIIDSNFTESFRFKKNSSIKIKDSIAKFYEENLFR